MEDHVVVYVDRLIDSQEVEKRRSDGCSSLSSSDIVMFATGREKEQEGKEMVIAEEEEEEPLIQMTECRICQEEDHIKNLESPCACSGSLKYAHRDCVQRWCNEKGDITCEICHQAYKSGYTAPSRPPSDSTTIDIGGAWAITGAPVDLRDSRLLAMASAQSRLLEDEYGEYDDSNGNPTSFCRFAALILMALLLLKHAISITTDEDDDDFSLFFMRAAGFLLPCYIMAWAMGSLHRRRRQRQEAAAMAAAEISFILQTGGGRSLQFTIAPEPELPPHQLAYNLQGSSST